ncbi:hypothetical protein [Streptomyces sp. NPDC048442]|uniref:hypothetical protein n=1 Tax=Streptomyces sp. NPDC048442 TaxID=3154823 RepID=UPI00343477A6
MGFLIEEEEFPVRRSDEPGPVIKFPRGVTRTFDQWLGLLHEEGLTWLTRDDVIEHLSAVAVWVMERGTSTEKFYRDPQTGHLTDLRVEPPTETETRGRLQDLCVRAGWPLLLPDGKRDHTTPAALAVSRAKSRLTEAMLADSIEQKASANTIAERARNAQSRPTTLKILAAELLRHDTVQALAPLFDADVALFVSSVNGRDVSLFTAWEDEPQEVRLRHLADAQAHLDAARLQLHDETSGEAVQASWLAADDYPRAEVRRRP